MTDPGLHALDWAVIVGYLVALAGVAWWARRPSATTGDYFLGGRDIPWWASACSFVATALSAATFVGVPVVAYGGDLSYLSANIAALIAIAVVAFVFLPVLFRSGVDTVYGLLGQRFGPGAAQAASIAFLIGRVFASGARLFIAALAVAFLLNVDAGAVVSPGVVAGTVVVLVLCGLGYSLFGGIRCVVWTDVFQAGLFVVAAATTIVVLLGMIEAPFSELVAAWNAEDKLQVFKLGLAPPGADGTAPGFFHPANVFSLPSLVLGMALINLGAYGTDQDLTQRLLACRDARRGAQSAITAVLMAIPITFLFLAVGLLLWVFYTQGVLTGADAPAGPDAEKRLLFPGFIAYHLPIGLRGLLTAGLLAAAISGLTSELNAMGSTFVADCYRSWVRGRDEKHYLRVGRWAVLGSAAALALFAIGCLAWQKQDSGADLLSFALGVMGFAYAGLVGVFLCALLTPRGSVWSACAGMALGSACYAVTKFSPINAELAFTWQMCIATVVSFAVCCLGRRAARSVDDV
ncbi:MAG: sodium:solute symporter [Planctomycetota bacterium]|jgi:SSS family solute:Na+ symporter|nr:sodium:solute symporter [Planctomycetota bacterium]